MALPVVIAISLILAAVSSARAAETDVYPEELLPGVYRIAFMEKEYFYVARSELSRIGLADNPKLLGNLPGLLINVSGTGKEVIGTLVQPGRAGEIRERLAREATLHEVLSAYEVELNRILNSGADLYPELDRWVYECYANTHDTIQEIADILEPVGKAVCDGVQCMVDRAIDTFWKPATVSSVQHETMSRQESMKTPAPTPIRANSKAAEFLPAPDGAPIAPRKENPLIQHPDPPKRESVRQESEGREEVGAQNSEPVSGPDRKSTPSTFSRSGDREAMNETAEQPPKNADEPPQADHPPSSSFLEQPTQTADPRGKSKPSNRVRGPIAEDFERSLTQPTGYSDPIEPRKTTEPNGEVPATDDHQPSDPTFSGSQNSLPYPKTQSTSNRRAAFPASSAAMNSTEGGTSEAGSPADRSDHSNPLGGTPPSDTAAPDSFPSMNSNPTAPTSTGFQLSEPRQELFAVSDQHGVSELAHSGQVKGDGNTAQGALTVGRSDGSSLTSAADFLLEHGGVRRCSNGEFPARGEECADDSAWKDLQDEAEKLLKQLARDPRAVPLIRQLMQFVEPVFDSKSLAASAR